MVVVALTMALLGSLPSRQEPQGADFERAEGEPDSVPDQREARRVLLDQVAFLGTVEREAAMQQGAGRRAGRLVEPDDEAVAVLGLFHGLDDDIGRFRPQP